MDYKKLYEKQYGKKKLISINSFPFLRKVFKRFDLHREDLALSLLDGGNRLLDVGSESGSLMFETMDKFEEVYGIDISGSGLFTKFRNWWSSLLTGDLYKG